MASALVLALGIHGLATQLRWHTTARQEADSYWTMRLLVEQRLRASIGRSRSVHQLRSSSSLHGLQINALLVGACGVADDSCYAKSQTWQLRFLDTSTEHEIAGYAWVIQTPNKALRLIGFWWDDD